MSCVRARDCVAVGDYVTAAGGFVLAERWNGARWRIEPTPAPGSDPQGGSLFGVSCTGARNCFAVGGEGQQPLIEHWDGAEWQVQTAPGASGTLESVSCTSATDCTAVGNLMSGAIGVPVFSPLAEHWDGVSWEIQATPAAPGAVWSVLNSVACTSASDCSAVGNATFASSPGEAMLAEHWNGAEWRVDTTPSVAGEETLLDSISCSSAGNCMAVGSHSSTSGSFGGPLVARRHGTDWQLGPSPATNSDLTAVDCTGPRRCTAVGTFASVAARWNGSTWRVEPFPIPPGATAASTLPLALSCATARDCAAVGEYDTPAGQFTLAARRS